MKGALVGAAAVGALVVGYLAWRKINEVQDDVRRASSQIEGARRDAAPLRGFAERLAGIVDPFIPGGARGK